MQSDQNLPLHNNLPSPSHIPPSLVDIELECLQYIVLVGSQISSLWLSNLLSTGGTLRDERTLVEQVTTSVLSLRVLVDGDALFTI